MPMPELVDYKGFRWERRCVLSLAAISIALSVSGVEAEPCTKEFARERLGQLAYKSPATVDFSFRIDRTDDSLKARTEVLPGVEVAPNPANDTVWGQYRFDAATGDFSLRYFANENNQEVLLSIWTVGEKMMVENHKDKSGVISARTPVGKIVADLRGLNILFQDNPLGSRYDTERFSDDGFVGIDCSDDTLALSHREAFHASVVQSGSEGPTTQTVEAVWMHQEQYRLIAGQAIPVSRLSTQNLPNGGRAEHSLALKYDDPERPYFPTEFIGQEKGHAPDGRVESTSVRIQLSYAPVSTSTIPFRFSEGCWVPDTSKGVIYRASREGALELVTFQGTPGEDSRENSPKNK